MFAGPSVEERGKEEFGVDERKKRRLVGSSFVRK
jgi:hypothetical protein